MPAYKASFLWISIGILGLSAAATPWAYRSLFPAIAPPRTVREMAELLSKAEPGLYVIPVAPNYPENGVWVCDRPQSWEQLSWLRRAPEHAYRWQGVVFCQKAGEMTEVVDTDTWGEHGMQIGPLLFFGDPALVRRIQKAILDHQSGKMFPASGGKEINQ
jgi:hypothetical protein